MISNTSELYDIWSELPIPIYMQFYMFNLSNPEEVKRGGKPFMVQKGPYTYRQVFPRVLRAALAFSHCLEGSSNLLTILLFKKKIWNKNDF